ncbi:Uncharacterized Nudix hydrolase P35G2.12 [Durusdinium trenchii]|uniref:Uncharacterized Nudix hydrolase P35G2.12 n=1 Tax=Durusdinium trenchii TaxID=1381693 RepID=A0ABP0RGM6_9DINO
MATAGVDAVIILPLLRSSSRPAVDTLLVQQFRPPVDAYTVELPAGLIDKGETAEQAAVRELKEETGYTGTARGKSSIPLTMSPGLSDETVKLVVVDVDMDKPENQQPQQASSGGGDQSELDEGEFIVVRRVSLASLPEELRSLALKGVMPITGDVGSARFRVEMQRSLATRGGQDARNRRREDGFTWADHRSVAGIPGRRPSSRRGPNAPPPLDELVELLRRDS